MKEKKKDKDKKNEDWEEIGKLKNGYAVLRNIKTEIINVEEDHMYIRDPHPEEWKEIFENIQERYQRWKRILDLIKNNLRS